MKRKKPSGTGGGGKSEKRKACPHCGSAKAIPVVYGLLTPRLKAAVRQGKAIAGDREEWEGFTEWHCPECGCEWSGVWMKFKRQR